MADMIIIAALAAAVFFILLSKYDLPIYFVLTYSLPVHAFRSQLSV